MSKFKDFKSGLIYCIMSGIALISLVILIVFSSIYGSALDIISFTLFGTSTFLLYLFATLYFWINNETASNVFKKFIHISIFMLITSATMCICFCALKGAWRWSIFGTSLGLSILGIIFSSIWANIPKIVLTVIYTLLSSIILIAFPSLISTFIQNNIVYSLLILLIEVIFYIVGAIFYNLKYKKLNFISHILFILGNTCYLFFMLKYLLFI